MNDSNIKSFAKRKLKVSLIMISVSNLYIIFIIGLMAGVYEILYDYDGALIFGIIFTISYFILQNGLHNLIRIYKFNKRYSETEIYKIDSELIHDDIELKNNKVYFTDNYFIETKQVIVIDYSKIALAFIAEFHDRRYYRIRLVIYLKDGTKYEFRKNKDIIIQKLYDKIPDLLTGYNFENIKKVKELYGITVKKPFMISIIDITSYFINEKPNTKLFLIKELK